MFRRIFCECVLFLLVAVPIGAETHDKNASADIRAVMVAQEAAWNRGDVDGFMNGYARSRTTVFVSGDTITRGWQTVRDRYKKKYATAEKMGRLTFSDLEITTLGTPRPSCLVVGVGTQRATIRMADSPCSSATCRKVGASSTITHPEVMVGTRL